jgi:hypothetical protein
MPAITLKSLLGRRSPAWPVVQALLDTMGGGVRVLDVSGAVLLGEADRDETAALTVPIGNEESVVGHVVGPDAQATAIASLVNHLWAKEIENRSLGSEVLHLYREVHLIEQLSEQLAHVIDLNAVGSCALNQAQRLIKATFGVLYLANGNGSLEPVSGFGNDSDSSSRPDLLPLVTSVLEKGLAEIVNDCASNPRVVAANSACEAILCAPLRSGEKLRGAIVLGSETPGASYAAADLKLLNTIALQTAAAVENALLCAEMVEAARHRAAYAAELQAASTVQQLLLQGGSRCIHGFDVQPVYVPASEVGGDFYFVNPADNGSLIAIVGDVSGKGLTAAMRVALILGALRREVSSDPAEILARLNNALVAQGQLGFTTALCIRLDPCGAFVVANAGHISPYVDGREFETAPALPLGLVADQVYETHFGRLASGEQIVILSDGIPEARSGAGELYGFTRLQPLTRLSAGEIAETARIYGQEDDITVLSIRLAKASEPLQATDTECEATA